MDNNALVGLEKCQGCELDSFISYFKPNITDDKIRALLPRDDVTTFDAKGKFLGLPVVAILTKGCQQIRHPDGGISCRYDPVRGVVFNTPFTTARDHLAQRYNLGAFKAKLLPDPTSKSRGILKTGEGHRCQGGKNLSKPGLGGGSSFVGSPGGLRWLPGHSRRQGKDKFC